MKKLLYLFLTVLIVACSGSDDSSDGGDNGGGDGGSNSVICIDNPIYLDDNGITVKACEDANVGDIGTINGVEYTVVDEAMLREMLANEEDVTKVATTRVTDMNEMFFDGITSSTFNQDIGNWDVSNVTDMGEMFQETSVKQKKSHRSRTKDFHLRHIALL